MAEIDNITRGRHRKFVLAWTGLMEGKKAWKAGPAPTLDQYAKRPGYWQTRLGKLRKKQRAGPRTVRAWRRQ